MEKRIQQIMDDFNFEKVYRVMKHLDWQWNFDQTYRVPSVDKLRSTALGLLQSRIESGTGITMSGGFHAVMDGDELTLEFVIEGSTALE